MKPRNSSDQCPIGKDTDSAIEDRQVKNGGKEDKSPAVKAAETALSTMSPLMFVPISVHFHQRRKRRNELHN